MANRVPQECDLARQAVEHLLGARSGKPPAPRLCSLTRVDVDSLETAAMGVGLDRKMRRANGAPLDSLDCRHYDTNVVPIQSEVTNVSSASPKRR
jgi:hypothetical protein